jgi:hypothetical protein
LEDIIQDLNIAKYYSIGEISGGIAYVISSELSNIESQLSYLQNFISQMPQKPNHCQEKIVSLTESVKNLRKITKELSQLIRHNENEPLRLIPFAQILNKVTLLSADRFRIHGVKFDIVNNKNININCREYQVVHAIVSLVNLCYSRVHSEKDAWVKIIENSNQNTAILEIYASHQTNDFVSNPTFQSIQYLINCNLGKIKTFFEVNKPLFILSFPIVINPYLLGAGCEK